MAKRKDEYDENGLPVSLPQGVRGMTSTLTGSQQTPGQMGTALGQMMGEVIAGLPAKSVAQNVTATTLGSKADGLAALVEAAAAQGSGTPESLQEGLRQNYGNYPPQPQPNAPEYDPQLDNFRRKQPGANAETRVDYAERMRRTLDPAYAQAEATREGQTASDRSEAMDPEQYRRAASAALDAQGAATTANAAAELKSKLSGNRPTGVQEIADLLVARSTPTETYGKTPATLRAEKYQEALLINEHQREKLKTMNPADFQNYGDAFQHAQLNGMSMSEALKFASDWSKIAPQGQQSSLQAAPRSAGTPQTNEQFRDSLHASNKRAAEVAQAVRDGIRARQAPPSATAPSGDPAAAPAAAPAKRPIREIDREDKELGVEAKKRQAQASKLNTIMTENKIKDDAMLEVLGEAFADDADGKRFEAFQALKPMQKQAQLTRWKTIWLARRKKEQTDGQ